MTEESTPKVSIVLPTFNGSRYIKQSIESCLSQTYTCFELIVVDGGSTDGTQDLVRGFTDPRIRLVHQPDNIGRLPGALNYGFAHARGEFFTWTQDDDFYAPEALATLVAGLENNPNAAMIYTGMDFIDAEGQICRHEPPRPPETLQWTNPIGCCFMYRREAAEKIGEYDVNFYLSEDSHYWMRIYKQFQIVQLPGNYFFHRLHSGSLTVRNYGAYEALRVAARARQVVLGISTSDYRRQIAQAYIEEAFAAWAQADYDRVWRCVTQGVRNNPSWLANPGVWSIGGRGLNAYMEEMTLSTAELLETAFADFARGEGARGRESLARVLEVESMFRNVAGLITPVRNYASRILTTPGEDPRRAVRFMEVLFANLPESVSTLANFQNTELAGVWIDVAFRAYALGQTDITRQAVMEAIRRQPGYFFNRGVLSIGLEAFLGRGVAATFRDAKPGAIMRRITLWRRKALIDRYLATEAVRRLHVGSGGFLLSGWLNSDLSPLNRGGVIYVDATQILPFEDNSLDFIFSEHFIEHLSYTQGRFFLGECQRVLKPGGVCRLATPNLGFLINVYTNAEGQYDAYARDRFNTWVGGDLYSRALVLNNAFHNWGHQCLYDFETLSGLLMKVGFKNVANCSLNESQHSDLQGLERHGAITGSDFNKMETMVLEAQK